MTNDQPQNKKTTLDDLAAMMERGFNEVRADIAAHDQKFDELSETVNTLPTTEEVQAMIDRTYSMAVLKAEHDRMKDIIRKKLGIEV